MLEATLQSVERALLVDRIGTVVSGRAVIHTAQNTNDIPSLLAKLIGTSQRWLASGISTLFAHGSIQAGQITVLLRFQSGGSCLVTAGIAGDPGPLADVTLFGNHGIISTRGVDVATRDIPAETWLQPTDEEKQFAQLVRQSLQTRQAVTNTGSPIRNRTGQSASSPTFNIYRRETRTPARPPFGVLLVAGDATHQPMYAEAFARDARCQIVGLVDHSTANPRRLELNQRYASRIGHRIFPDFSEAVARPDVHIVSVCAEPERRATIITEAARARRHLYLDKPLCATVQEAAEIVAAVRQNKVLAHMFSQILWEPALRVREVIASEKLGEIQAVHCDLTFAKGHTGGATLGRPRTESAQPTSFELPDAKRELTNIGVYCLVQLLSSFSKNIRRVYASTGNYFFGEHQSRDVEDFGQILMELDGGITASVTAGRTGWQSHPAGGLNRVFVVGRRGSLLIDAHEPRAEIWSDGGSWQPPPRDPEDPISMWGALPDSPFVARPKSIWITPHTPQVSDDIRHFLNCLEQGRDSEMTVEIAASATEALLAAYHSAATGEVCDVR